MNNTGLAASQTWDAGGLTVGGSVNLGTHVLTLDPFADNLAITGPISGVGGSLVIDSIGQQVILSGNSSFTGGVTVNTFGELAIGHDSALGTGPLTVDWGYLRAVGGARTLANSIVMSGPEITIEGSQDLAFLGAATLPTAPGEKTWGVDAAGNASVGANWIGGVAPGGIGDAAGFTTIITAPRTVTIDAPLTLGTMRFDDDNNYTLAGPNAITLQHSGANHAVINVLNLHGNGQHTIAAPLLVLSDLDVAQNSAGEFTLAGGLATNAGRSLTKTGSGTLAISGLQSYGVGASFAHTAGTLNLLTDAGAGGANLSLAAGATTNFTSSQHLAALEVAANVTAALSAGGGKVLSTRALGVAAGGRLDLADNDFVLRSTPAARLADAAAIESLVASGAAGLAWNGPGIDSSAAAGDASFLTALGVMLNDDGFGGPFRATFAGEPVDANSVLVKYTYYGDADLSGSVDGTDYALTDNGFNSGLSGWFHGDFDYSGHVDGTDYALIDNAFNGQSGPLGAGPIGPAVPEPGTLFLLALGSLLRIVLPQLGLRGRHS